VAPARPYWKGYLKLSLVSCPVALYSATSSGERVTFRQINKATGNRVRQQLIDDETREPVEAADKGRGYEVSKGVYVMIEDEEIDSIAIESSHTVDIDTFVPREQIDQRYLDSPYYLVPDDRVGQEAFAVIRDAMRGKSMVALGRVVLSKRERVIMLEPWEKGLLGTTLRYPYELRDAATYFDDIPEVKIPKEMLALAEHILESKEADFEPEAFVDHYEEALVEMLRQKQAGMPAPKSAPAPRAANVINLFDALKQSLAQEGKASRGKSTDSKPAKAASSKAAAEKAPAKAPAEKTAKAPAAKPKTRKRIEGQGEMLLPISGKKAAAASAAEPAKKPAAARTVKEDASAKTAARPRRKAS